MIPSPCNQPSTSDYRPARLVEIKRGWHYMEKHPKPIWEHGIYKVSHCFQLSPLLRTALTDWTLGQRVYLLR